jgi:hypothetical protein
MERPNHCPDSLEVVLNSEIPKSTLSTFYYPYIQYPLGGTHIVYMIDMFQIIRPDPGRIDF